MSVNKYAGNQKYYVNERNEAAEAVGGDFLNIGSICLKFDSSDIDVDGWSSYSSGYTQDDCLNACRESVDCVGVSVEIDQNSE